MRGYVALLLMFSCMQVVEPDYVRQSWVEKRLKAWEEECLRAETAATIEKLIKVCALDPSFTYQSHGLSSGYR